MNKNLFKNRILISAAIAFLSALCCFLSGRAGLFTLSDYRAYDTLFYLKSVSDKSDPPDPPVVIIAIDDQTVKDEKFQIPKFLWNKYFGKMIWRLADIGAKVIGLDYQLSEVLFDKWGNDYSNCPLQSMSSDDSSEKWEKWDETWEKCRECLKEYSHPLLQSIVYAQSKGTRIVSGFQEFADREVLPHSRYQQIIGRDMGFFNLTTDADDVIRRQRLIYTSGGENPDSYSFSYLLFKAGNPEYSPPSDTIWIDYARPDPFVKRYSFQYSFIEVYRKICENDLYFLRRHFEGKTVLLGSADPQSKDRHLTPLRSLYQNPSLRTYGVEIHANVLLTLYHGRFFSEIPAMAGFGLCFVLSLAVSLAALYGRFRYAMPGLPVSLLFFWIISFFSFTQYHLLPYTAASLSACLGLLLSFAWKYKYMDRESRKIQSLFDSFQESRVVKELLKSDDQAILAGKNMRLCVLFSDIRDFTPFCEERSDEEVVLRLNEYYAVMSETVHQENGIVNRFLGDGMLAFFGAYENTDNPSLAAVNAGIRMIAALDALNIQWKIRGEKSFKIGIGLHTGTVQLGALGSTRRREFTLTGDTANLAARVQSATKELGETFLITDAVYQEVVGRLPKGIEFKDWEFQKVKGREPVHMWSVRIKEAEGGKHEEK